MLAQILVNGVMMGGVYALVAVSMTLVFAVTRLVNFAQGVLVAVGMYLAFILTAWGEIDLYLALPLIAVLCFLLGYLLFRGIERIAARPPLAQLTLTLGLMVALEALIEILFGTDPLRVRVGLGTLYLDDIAEDLYLSGPRLVAWAASLALAAALWAFLRYARWGQALRAVAQHPRMAMLVGIPARQTLAVAFGVSTAVAGLAGALVSPFITTFPYVGHGFLAAAFAAIVIGTKGNILGAFIGGQLIGLAEAFGVIMLGDVYKEAMFFGLVVLTLVFRPEGLFSHAAR